MKKVILILVVFCFHLQPASAQWWRGSDKVEGNGEVTTTTRNVSEYDQVALEGSMDVELRQGTEGTLTIEAESNLHEYIETEVEGGRLKISVKKGYNIQPSRNNNVTITVPFEDLDQVSLTGSGDISSSDEIRATNFEARLTGSGDVRLPVKAKNAEAHITGSGDIELRGSAQDFECNVTGSGDVSAFEFRCQRVRAKVTGSGDIQVYASEELQARVPGSGDIQYKGNPKKEDFKTMGSGSVTKK